jgi:hypothetical protein
MKRGEKLSTKVYREPTHAAQPPISRRKEVVHSLIGRAKAMRQNKKIFNIEIKNISHDLMLNEYPQEFTDFMMKPSRSNRPFSVTIYKAMPLTHMLGVSPKNSSALETVSISGSFSKLNIHYVGH